MNKIELLPKDIYFEDTLYQLSLWVTGFGRLCIGYRNAIGYHKPGDFNKNHLCSVCVEPENEPHEIVDRNSEWINAGIGNAVSVDDACDELMNYIEKNKEDFKIRNYGVH